MKKIIIAIILIPIVLASRAQITFGPKAGMNIAYLKGKDADTYDIKALSGFHAGGFVNVPFSKFISSKAELLYAKVAGTQTYLGETGSFYLKYISLPVQIQYKIRSGFYGEIGPQIDFLLSSEITALGMTQDVSDDFTKTNFSAAIGVGYDHSSGLGVNIRYSLGLTKIAENGSDIKTDVISIGLLYRFNQVKKTKK
jgi:hypothetical protein